MDHATPGSSFTVGHELVESIFGMPRPAWFGYGFVGFAGVQKMSSSAGGAPTAEDALRVLEAPILRWLYVRRNPKQTFNIDFGAEVVRLYDEWDALGRKAADPERRDAQVLAYERAVVDLDRRAPAHRRRSSCRSGCCPRSPTSPPASAELISRDRRAGRPPALLGGGPRSRGSTRRWTWTREFVDPADRTTVRTSPTATAGRACRRSGRSSASGSTSLLDNLPDELDLEPTDRAGLRRAQARPRHGPRRQADRRGQGRPEGVLRALYTCSSTPTAAASDALALARTLRSCGADSAAERRRSAARRR